MERIREFARDFINHKSARTAERKKIIRDTLFRQTGRRLSTSCSTCYIEAIFKILKYQTMANYEMRKGYVAQFRVAYRGIKAFTTKDIIRDPAKYEPIAAEYLRQYPERAIFFIRIPKAAPKPEPKPVEVKKEIKPEPPVEDIINEIIRPVRSRRRTTRKTDD